MLSFASSTTSNKPTSFNSTKRSNNVYLRSGGLRLATARARAAERQNDAQSGDDDARRNITAIFNAAGATDAGASDAAAHQQAAAVFNRRAALLAAATAAGALPLTPQKPARADDEDGSGAAAAATEVFVAGATGRTGRRVVQQLRAAGFKVRAGARDPRKAQALGFGLDTAGLEVVKADVVAQGASALAEAIGPARVVVCCTGATGLALAGAGAVDEEGTIKLIDAAKAAGARRFVLLTSLLTNAKEAGQADNPNYKFLNLFGGVLDHKLAAERYLRSSGLEWVIVRPGGLSDEPPEKTGNLVVGREDSLFGLDTDPGRAISRDTVAEVLVAAATDPSAAGRVIEIVASPTAPPLPRARWFDV